MVPFNAKGGEMKTYKIHEIFYSLQGEGPWTGKAMVFVRFWGCNLKCEFCDTSQSEEDVREMTTQEIWQYADRLRPEGKYVIVCLTGGEPLLQVDKEFLEGALPYPNLYSLHLETNGTILLSDEMKKYFSSVIVSPKQGQPLQMLSELFIDLKFIYTKEQESFILKTLRDASRSMAHISPMSNGKQINWQNVQDAVLFCLENPQLQLGLQMHKILNLK